MTTETRRMTKAEAGRLGGLVTLAKYGRESYRDWGKLGGRPEKSIESEAANNKRRSGPGGAPMSWKKVLALAQAQINRSTGRGPINSVRCKERN